MTELLVNDFDNYSKDEFKERLSLMKTSNGEMHHLLDRILEWQIMQQDTSSINLEKRYVKRICDELITQQSFADNMKGITVLNLIPENSIALCDERFMNTIFRNLLSNEIEFCKKMGS